MGWGAPRTFFATAFAVALLAVPPLAAAHLERPSYWPDPAPDTSVSPPAGGQVPQARPLASAVTGSGPGEVRVVCQQDSLSKARRSIASAHDNGFRVRPSQPKTRLSDREAADLLAINEALADRCEFHSIQKAVNDSGNNDRVVVMPGRYLEPHSRKQPINDPACADMLQDNGHGGMAPSYRYQTECPNDQNLIYIQGREVPAGPPPEPPLEEREGIPDLGPCLRCNLQLEGSGAKPSDVIMDAGKGYAGKGNRPGAKPGLGATEEECSEVPGPCYAKDVVLRVDRADGFVGRNFLTKSSTEHGVYLEEVDGYLLDRTKFFWSAEYGNLTFTSDHGVYKNCDSYGAGDAAVYPGAAPETGVGVEDTDFYPDAPRINTVVKKCDLRSSALAYSGSQGNAVRITHNEIYANTTGLVTDSISAGGHPGYPPDSLQIDHNNIYSNNFNSYSEDRPFLNTVGLPIGVGIMWPGVNYSHVHDNYIFDNWRRGTMLMAIPEATTRGEPEDPSASGECPLNPQVVTSCGDEYEGNFMGQAPPHFKPSVAVGKFGNPSSLDDEDDPINGVDFWWDEFVGNVANCWHGNVGPDGTRDSLTADPPLAPLADQNVPGFLPEVCDNTSVGTGDVVKEAVLANCGTGYTPGEEPPQPPLCDWFAPPPEPGSSEAKRYQETWDEAAARYRKSAAADRMRERMRAVAGATSG
jgi:hypothetical protein